MTGAPMSEEEITFFKSIAGGREPPTRRPREVWAICGRRSGKDSIASAVAAHAAASFNPKGILRPGEKALVACVAPDRETGRIVRSYVGSYFELIPPLNAMVTRVTQDTVELNNNVEIAVLTNNYRVVRGRPILMAILDEVAFFRDDNFALPDTELYAALTPGLSSIPQAQMIGISTPHMKSGLLWKKHKASFGVNDDDAMVIVAPSHVMNPQLNTRDRDRMLIEDPDKARAEYWAEWRLGLAQFIDPLMVNRATVPGRIALDPVVGINYVAAVDMSGGSSDAAALGIAHAEGDRAILDYAGEWPSPHSPEQVTMEMAAICRRYNVNTVIGDKYAGEWPRERFRFHRINYDVAPWTRSDAYLTLLPALNTPGRIELLDNQRLVAQLCGLVRTTVRGGRDIVDHARGARDDLINAGALALVAAALAPKGHAENWLTYMRMELERAGDTDVDDIRAPGPDFGYGFNAKPEPDKLVTIEVPPIIASGNSAIMIHGRHYVPRYREGRAYLELKHDHARWLLEASEPWRLLNPTAAKELLSEGSAA
jgi:hypothetical protein